ncbi:MAG: protein NO VEIN domain-containing protein, partial [Bacteriovorax sp.]
FLGYPFHKEVNLSRVYAGTGAPIIVLDLQNRTRKKKVKQKQANVDWEQWKEFLIKCGAKTGPFLVQVDVAQKYTRWSISTDVKKEDSAFLASIKQEIKKHQEFTADQETNFRLYLSYSVSFDPFTSVLIAEKRNNKEIVKHLDSIFHSFNDKKTTIKFIWGQKQNPRQVIIDSFLAAEQLENGLMIASNQGVVLSQRCYVNNSENKRIFSHLVPLVDDHKYSPVFLRTIGVKETVSVSDLQALIENWFLETEQKSIDGFLPYVEMIVSYLNFYPKDEHKINLHIQLFDPENDLLIKIDDWLKSACNMGFSESIVKRLANALSVEQIRTPEQLLDTLFDFEDISSSPESLLNVLVDIGLVPDKESQLKELFVHKLATQGLMYSGHKITTTDELPFIWDQFPVPKSNSNLIVCRPTRSQAKKLQFALEEFEWTCLSQSNPEIHFGEEIKISDVDCRRVYLSMSEVISSLKGDRPSLAQRVEKLGLFSDKDQIQSKIYRATNLKVIFSVNGKSLSINVPYWFSKEKLAIDSEHDISIEIPRFVDEKTGTTFKALFRYIWEAKEKESRVYGAKGDEGDINQPPKYTGGNHTGEPGENGTDNGSKSDLDDNIFDDEKENNDSEDGLDTGNSFDPNNPSRRKRIHSVSLCTHSRKGNGQEKQFAHQHNQKVEEAGRKRLIAYLEELGAEVISRESENVGYDFEVSIGDEAFYIELKSSQDQWVGWEHTLSANEFKKALELKDKYFLCAIDYSFNDEKYQFYFIQNPAENVDYFAFDSPWKALSLSMNAYISRLKDKQGMAA